MACVRQYRGSWIVDWRDEQKKRHLDQVASEAEGHRRLAELKDNEMKAPNKNSFKEYGEWWLENCAKGEIKDSTYEEYERALNLHLYPVFGFKPFSKITRKMVRELITAKKKAGLSQSSIRNILAPMRGMYNHAMEDDELQRNPASRMGKFNKKEGDKPAINPLSREETQVMLDKAETDYAHYYPLFLCAPRAGLREGELIALKGIDLDFNGRFIEVQRNLSRGRITTPKNGKTRRVDMSNRLTAVLNDLLSRKRAVALRKEMAKEPGERRHAATVVNEVMEDWLFTTPQGAQLDPSNLRKVFYRVLWQPSSAGCAFTT
jgi:integrase